MLCSPKRIVLLASVLSSLASCRSLCRPKQTPITGPSNPPTEGSTGTNASTSNNPMMMPNTTPAINDTSGTGATGSSGGSSYPTEGQPSTNSSAAGNDTPGGSSSPVGDLPDTNSSSTPPSTSPPTSPSTNDTSVPPTSPVPSSGPGGFPKSADKCLPPVNGVNMAGLEFGMDTNGAVNGKGFVAPPLDQIPHFAEQKMNVIRFPIAWQYVQPKLNEELNATYVALLDEYIKATTSKNAYAIIDLHNFARLDGKIVGQDMPAAALVDCWTRLAKHYMNQPLVILGLMNEPHDVDSKKWIEVVQQLVTAIRKAGAQNNILMPGNNWCHLKTFADDYNGGLSAITNPDGTKNGLMLEIHQYFDSDESGTNKECTQDHVDVLTSVAAMLKKDGRQALVSELGGGNSDSCKAIISKFVKAVTSNYPAIAGSVMWGAGAFAADYTLVLTVKEGSGWKDQINLEAMKTASLSSKAS